MNEYTANIQFDAGAAVVQTGNNKFRIARRDENCEKGSCPTELIVGALGS
jgi:hypothetical protein